jgi:putative hydrolase of HD superfamily
VVELLLTHDLVEAEAGDTFCYDGEAVAGQAQREEAAAERLFGLLPADQAARVHALWDEFERRETAEARFAVAVDRLLPLLLNYFTDGASWREADVRADQVAQRIEAIDDASAVLGELARSLLADAVEQGYLAPGGELGHSSVVEQGGLADRRGVAGEPIDSATELW